MTDTDDDNTPAPMTGGCLCGAVRYQVARARGDGEVTVCHCKMCQRWAGGVYLSLRCADRVTFVDEAQIGVYVSSAWAERGFCKVCGTGLFYRVHGSGHVSVLAGTLDNPRDLSLGEQIFIDRKPAYYDFANETPKITEADVLKRFGS